MFTKHLINKRNNNQSNMYYSDIIKYNKAGGDSQVIRYLKVGNSSTNDNTTKYQLSINHITVTPIQSTIIYKNIYKYITRIIIRTIKAGGDNRVNHYPDPGNQHKCHEHRSSGHLDLRLSRASSGVHNPTACHLRNPP